MREFKLPDLGEGLTEAEIVEWHVAANDEVKLNQPLVSVETDKAVVEVPSPVSGRVVSIHGEAGDVIPVGDVLARFDVPGSDAALEAEPGPAEPAADGNDSDNVPGVVGELPASAVVMSDTTGSAAAAPKVKRVKAAAAPKVKRVKAAPSVRALARELGVDLTGLEGSGPGGRITAKDVAKAADAASGTGASRPQGGESATDEKLSGPRRAMFRSMTAAHSEVALCTVMDDADIHDWESPRDFTPRLIRAMAAGARAEPRLNGTFSAQTGVLSMAEEVHMGLAMDTAHGLIVATIYNAGTLSLDELREEVTRLKKAGADRTLKPEEVRGYTITLSNIASGSSRYATPLMVPPTVGILGSGAARDEVVALNGEIAIRRMLPLSLTFDHRCVAGADASRFLSAVVADLKLAS